MNIYMWRDRVDPNLFWIGPSYAHGGKQNYTGWIHLYADAIGECFGRDTWEVVRDLSPGGDPVRVHLELCINPQLRVA